MAEMPNRMLVAFGVGALLLSGAVGAVIGSILDADNRPTSVGPPCTSGAIRTALQQHGTSAASVTGVQCGHGWAGATYETAQAAGAALLKSNGRQWVVVDRAQGCKDASVPSTVRVYCLVS